nr:MAG TPA: hypothetical protein [Caudoviricetes sp.]
MTTEELEQKVKRLEEELTEVRIALLESKADKKPYEVEVPEDIGDYYNPDEFGVIDHLEDFSTAYGENCYIRGLAFKTTEEAEQFDKERILLFKLHKWAEEHNGGWIPNWSDVYEKKHYIAFEKEGGIFDVNWSMCYQQFTKLPYFKSVELAWEFVEEFGEQIKEVLC